MRKLCSTFVCLLLPILSIHAETISVVTEVFAPYNYQKDGKVTGISVDIVSKVFEKLNITPQYQVLPWAEAYKTAVKNDNTLIFSMAKNPARDKLFQWVGTLSSVDVCLFSLAHRKDINISHLSQAKQLKVITQPHGHISQVLRREGFKERLNLKTMPTINQSIQMLENNEADLIGYPLLVLQHHIKQQGQQPEKLLKTQLCFNNTELYMAFNKTTSKNIVNKFKLALQSVKQEIDWELNKVVDFNN